MFYQKLKIIDFDIFVSTIICSKHLFSIQAHQFHSSILTLGVDPGLRPALQAGGHHGPLLLPPVQLGPGAAGRGTSSPPPVSARDLFSPRGADIY